MVKKVYTWTDGAKIEDHTKRKHKVLREYVFDYMAIRCCQVPNQSRFRLAIVDGFSGGGRYECGEAGSPLIFIEELKRATNFINIDRMSRGLGPVDIECKLFLNDSDRSAINILKGHVTPLVAEINENCTRLHLEITFFNEDFELAYPKIKQILGKKYRNVLFNLDQCGDKGVRISTIADIMRSYHRPEIFFTFMIGSLLAFLNKKEPENLKKRLGHLGLTDQDLQELNKPMTENSWLGAAERIVYDSFESYADYVSPFCINNPDGWRYWMMHFANSYRARQAYNNVLHKNSSLQAHYGRSGINMLHYDPNIGTGTLYLFDKNGRESSIDQLMMDIPQLVTDSGNEIPVTEFYKGIYNCTPAHSEDIHTAIIDNPDLEVITPNRGKRRKANTINSKDVIKRKRQITLFSFPR